MISARVRNLAEFMFDTNRAKADVPPATTRGLKKANDRLLPEAAAAAPRLTGELAGSGSSEVHGNTAALVFSAEHAPIIEWFRQGRFRGLTARYGAPPRFAARTINQREDLVVDVIEQELDKPVTADGWFR